MRIVLFTLLIFTFLVAISSEKPEFKKLATRPKAPSGVAEVDKFVKAAFDLNEKVLGMMDAGENNGYAGMKFGIVQFAKEIQNLILAGAQVSKSVDDMLGGDYITAVKAGANLVRATRSVAQTKQMITYMKAQADVADPNSTVADSNASTEPDKRPEEVVARIKELEAEIAQFQSQTAETEQRWTEEDQLISDIPTDQAVVYVMRTSILGLIMNLTVSANGKEMGKTKGKTYLRMVLAPGDYLIESKGENTDTIELKLEAGNSYYIHQKPQMGIVKLRNKIELVDEDEGAFLLTRCGKER